MTRDFIFRLLEVEPANRHARKVIFTCVVCFNDVSDDNDDVCNENSDENNNVFVFILMCMS